MQLILKDRMSALCYEVDERVPGDSAIMEFMPPYSEWSERKVVQHLSGHAVYMFDGVTCLFFAHTKRCEEGHDRLPL